MKVFWFFSLKKNGARGRRGGRAQKKDSASFCKKKQKLL
jgi:hypothetical protein